MPKQTLEALRDAAYEEATVFFAVADLIDPINLDPADDDDPDNEELTLAGDNSDVVGQCSQSTSTTTTSARLAAPTSPESVDSSQPDVRTLTGEPTTLHFAISFEHFQAIHDLLETQPRRSAIHLCYYDGAITITLNPTGPHENAHVTLSSIIKTLVANAHPNGLPGHDALLFLGAKSHFSQVEAISLQGDSVLAPLVSPNGPTLVIECGHSPTDPSLPIGKMDAWFRGFPFLMKTRLCLLSFS
ncbi:hypothetical protein C8R47DRAFT_1067914 [Mycena vitilis]|nr:hypothetical protein C8R47DRAFT_1067914 [Mycena vitilis]